ncbi:hypothetical protein ACQ4PT_017521 [Festuca glaucescens]
MAMAGGTLAMPVVAMAMPVVLLFSVDDTAKAQAVAMGTVLAGDTKESEGAIRSGIDADLLQQTVQAVVAAVTAATRANGPPIVHVPAATVMQDTGVVDGQTVGAPVAVPNPTVQQQKEMTQETPESNDIAAKDKEIEGQGAPKKKKEDKASCFRCKKPGYYIDDCPTPFCDICESIHHATPACHLLNAPKPTATLHGYANEALMFFELSCGVFKAKAENPKLAKVTVDGAALTIPEIIEQLKKIVPSEKFTWEVFHLKENIFRVKLPSKLEVRRLKNFGTYICTDRDSCLTFDSWSSVEEPLYMLPEVWVRVLGLPSDIRTDYLALWGVGTLFGKTLDVDMAYTRKNKVLRTKIGCLNHKLIPADSDMFIRRGFYKLRFEVEIDDHSQEVNMVDANNGFDGHDGANQGEGKNGGGHDMDMDNKGNDTDAASKDNEQDVSSMHNGVDGMQEQCGKLDAVQIGTMQVKLVSPGNISDAKNLNKKEHVYTPISHVEFAALDDEIGSDYHADLLSSGSALGSGVVGPREEGRQPVIGQVLPDAHLAQHAANGQLLHAGRPQPLVPSVHRSPVAASTPCDSQVAAAGHLGAATCGRWAGPGSSAAREKRPPAAAGVSGPQKIWAPATDGQGQLTPAEFNHCPMIADDSGVADAAGSAGLGVQNNGVARGMFPVLNDEKIEHVVTNEYGVFQQDDLYFSPDPVHTEDDCFNVGVGLEPILGHSEIGGDCLIFNVCW